MNKLFSRYPCWSKNPADFSTFAAPKKKSHDFSFYPTAAQVGRTSPLCGAIRFQLGIVEKN